MDKGQHNHARTESESSTETRQQEPQAKGRRKNGRLGRRTKRGNALLDALVHTAHQEGIAYSLGPCESLPQDFDKDKYAEDTDDPLATAVHALARYR